MADAALILLELAIAYGKGILAMCRTRHAESAYPVLRSLLEAWAEFRYLMQPGARADRVHEMWVSATLAMRDEVGPNMDRTISGLEADYKASFQKVVANRRRSRTGHHSGVGRKRLITDMCGPPYDKLYSILSWEAHPIVQVWLNSPHRAGVANASQWKARNWSDQKTIKSRVAQGAYMILRYIWDSFSTEFSPAPSRARGRARRRSPQS